MTDTAGAETGHRKVEGEENDDHDADGDEEEVWTPSREAQGWVALLLGVGVLFDLSNGNVTSATIFAALALGAVPQIREAVVGEDLSLPGPVLLIVYLVYGLFTGGVVLLGITAFT